MSSIDLSRFWTWNVDPILVRIFDRVEIRYYGLFFAIGILLGYRFWIYQMSRAGHSSEIIQKFFVWGTVATIVGARLGQCLFYAPEYYLANPLEILMIQKGGLSSHGATIGLVTALFLFAQKYRFSFLEVLDRFAMSATMGAIFVRVGNFMNSEIVGREWFGPWAIRFPRYDSMNQYEYEAKHGALGYVVESLPRHPSQIYEVLVGTATFCFLFLLDKKLGEKRPLGLLAGVFFFVYFGLREFTEQFKEYERLSSLEFDFTLKALHVVPTSQLTMGQWLSPPFIILGFLLIVWALLKRKPASALDLAKTKRRR